MRLGGLLVVLVGGAALSVVGTSGSAWAGTNWVAQLAIGSKGEAHTLALPAAPASPAASCNAPLTSATIKVTWSAVTHATTYSVYESTTSASGTYSLIASGVASASWTSGTLTSGTRYWFEVVANVGSHWSSVKSAATGSSLVNAVTPFCSQP